MCNECGNDEETICRVPIARIIERNQTEPNFMMYFCVTTVSTMLFGLYTHDVNPINRIAHIQNAHFLPFLIERCFIQRGLDAQREEGQDTIIRHFLEFLKVLFKFALHHNALEEQAGTNIWVWNVRWVHNRDVLAWLADRGCPMDVDNDMCCFWIRAYMQGQAASPQILPPQPQPPQPPRRPRQPQRPQPQPLPPQNPPAPSPAPAPAEQELVAFTPHNAHTPAPINNVLVLNTGPLAGLLGRGPPAQQAPPADNTRTEKALELQRRFLDTCLKMNEAGASKDRYIARLQRICRSMEKLV